MASAATHILKIVIQVVDRATAGMRSVDTATKSIEKNVGRINRRMQTFDMRLLSLMFGGMALKRVMGSMARSLINTFIKAEDSTSGLAKATVRLNAAWEFLKFSIVDALNTEFFIGMIDSIIQTIDWFSQLGDGAKQMILGIIGGLFTLGAVMMVIGQTKLFTDAVFGGGGFLNKIIKSLGFSGILGIMILIAAVVITLKTKWAEVIDISSTWWDVIKEPLTNINDSLNEMSSTLGFENFLDLIGTVGISVFAAFGAILINVAFAIDLIIIGLANLAKGMKAVLTGDFDALIRLQGESFSDGIDWFDRWTEANAKFLDGMGEVGDKMEEKRRAAPPIRTGDEFLTFGGGADINVVEATINKVTESVNSNIEAGKIAMGGYSESLSDEVIPQVDNLIATLTGEGGLLEGMGLQGEEMDLLAGEKTLAHTASSNTQIGNNDKVADSWKRLLSAARDYANFQTSSGDSIDILREQAAPSD